MKLLKKTSLNFVSASIFFFLFASIVVYFMVRIIADNYSKSELLQKRMQVEYALENEVEPMAFSGVEIKALSSIDSIDLNEEIYSDTIVYNAVNNGYELNKQLVFYMSQRQQWYKVVILQSLRANDVFIMIFTLLLITMAFILFMILFLVNRQSIKSTLKVFYSTIDQLQEINVNRNLELDINADIDEFKQLNVALNNMSERIKQDFLDLKQYTENTSHELQTPLAILNARLEELLQDDNLTSQQLVTISNLVSTVDRLSNINKALIFLTKIDHRMYNESDDVSLKKIVEESLEFYTEMIEDKQIDIHSALIDVANIKANPMLIQTLINNILSNAIKHNVDGGELWVDLSEDALVVKNTGKTLNVPAEQLFKRFEKGNSGVKSLGIGLSIVRKIAEMYHFKISYTSQENWHVITLTFK